MRPQRPSSPNAKPLFRETDVINQMQLGPLPRLTLLHLIQLGNLIKQLTRLLRVRDPCRGTRQPRLEVIGSSAQKLVSNMQCLPAINSPKDPLTGQNTPGLVTNIHEYVVPTCWASQTILLKVNFSLTVEGAKWQSLTDFRDILTRIVSSNHASTVRDIPVSFAQSKLSPPMSLDRTCGLLLV